MPDRRVYDASFGGVSDRIPPQSQLCKEAATGAEASGGVEMAASGESTEFAQEIGTACYLCYGQCVNFGVQGERGRPCARGVTALVERRRKARARLHVDHGDSA